MKLYKILHGIKKVSLRGPDRDISGIAYDSRSVVKNGLFVAVTGLKAKGSDYIPQAVSRGASAIVYDEDIQKETGKEVTFIKVSDAREALSRISANFFGEPSKELRVAGVTGTNGKTTITYLVEHILNAASKKSAVVGTISHRIDGKPQEAKRTTPEASDLHDFLRKAVSAGVTHAVMEASSHALVLKRLEDIQFDVCLFSNLASDHMDFHGTREEYLKAKTSLFTRILEKSAKNERFAVLNWDDPSSKEISRLVSTKIVRYGLRDDVDLGVEKMSLSQDGIKAKLRVFDEKVDIESNLTGRFNLSNILAAAAISRLLGADMEHIQTGILSLGFVPGRLEKIRNDRGINVYVDYAHTEDALRKVLEMFNDLKTGRIITVFGCGGDRDREKRPKMGAVASSMSDISFVTSDNPRSEEPLKIIEHIVAGIDGENVRRIDGKSGLKDDSRYYAVIPDRREAIETAIKFSKKGDTVLIAGKGHEDYQESMDGREYFSDRDCVTSIFGE